MVAGNTFVFLSCIITSPWTQREEALRKAMRVMKGKLLNSGWNRCTGGTQTPSPFRLYLGCRFTFVKSLAVPLSTHCFGFLTPIPSTAVVFTLYPQEPQAQEKSSELLPLTTKGALSLYFMYFGLL